MDSPHPTNTRLFTPKMRGSQFSTTLPCSIIPIQEVRGPWLVQVTSPQTFPIIAAWWQQRVGEVFKQTQSPSSLNQQATCPEVSTSNLERGSCSWIISPTRTCRASVSSKCPLNIGSSENKHRADGPQDNCVLVSHCPKCPPDSDTREHCLHLGLV